jgi:hypothetical protein
VNNYFFILRLIFLVSWSNFLYPNIDDYFSNPVSPSASNYGNTGILELPNARFMPSGSLRFNFSGSFPYEHTSLTATPFSWFEATYRYTEIKNQKYGPYNYSGNQSLKDKGLDIKFQLLEESYRYPSIAVGLRDIAGTGIFSSEYFLASKRFGNFDFTTGVGWGLLGSEGGLSSPLAFLHDSFKERSASFIQGGTFTYQDWFSGDAALFGGVEYDLKKYGLRFKLEYDTSNPDINPLNSFPVRSRFNLGMNYYLSESFNMGVAFERGQVFRVSFSLKGDFAKDTIPKPKPKIVQKLSKEQQEKALKDKGIFYRSLNKSLRDESIYIQGATYQEDSVDVAISSTRFFSVTRMAGRAARIVSALSADSVKEINVHAMNGSLEIVTLNLNREEFDASDNYRGSPVELLNKSRISSTSNKPLYLNADFIPTVDFPQFDWNISPSLKHQIGGPEGFYLGQLSLKVDTSLKFSRNIGLYTSFSANIYDTFNDFNNASISSIPHVRSDIQNYLKQGKNSMQRMQLEYMFSPIKDIFIRGDLGYLEEMFAGFGGEILYRPVEKNIALGLSVHKVQQRGFKQRFSLRDYKTTTGHLKLYYELPKETHASLRVGKYLAGDNGVTLDLARRFQTGFMLGIFATKTNLSTEEFGEGSFDKGFYFSVPIKLFYSDYKPGIISFGMHPLTKDGGALINEFHSLYGITGDAQRRSVLRDWNYIMD